MDPEEILAKFSGVRGGSRQQWSAKCPAHDDRKASLSIGVGEENKILLTCHAGCSRDAILAAAGLEESDLFPRKERPSRAALGPIVATYDYTDLEGKLLYQVTRHDPKDFRQRRRDGNGGWIWNIRDVPRVPYRWRELVGHPSVLIVEGEKDADVGWSLGFPTTTNAGGAGKWSDAETVCLRQIGTLSSWVAPDADVVGRRGALQTVHRVRSGGLTSVLAPLPGKDLADAVAHGLTREGLLDCLRQAQLPTVQSQVASTDAEWIVQAGIGYQLTFPHIGTRFNLTRIRLEEGQTKGLLTVRTKLAGAKTLHDDIISCAEFNCAVQRGRAERAKHLQERTKTEKPHDVDWPGLIEEFCVRVLDAEESQDVELPLESVVVNDEDDEELIAAGFPLIPENPVIWFGDGGTGKSYLALYAAVDLAQRGYRILYCDWETSEKVHKRRLTRLVGPVPAVPTLWYVRCSQPLVRETARVQAILARRQIQVLICDSVGYASQGAPETSEAALGYFQALRAFGPVTSLHLAHVNKSEQGDQKPFGSNYWHNSARSTWFLKRSDTEAGRDGHTVGFYHRKTNTGPYRSAFGVRVQFVGTETRIMPVPLVEPELTAKLPLKERLTAELLRSAHFSRDVAEALNVSESSIRVTVSRWPDRFLRLPDGRIGLKHHD
jgi:AAA domain